MQLSLAQSLAGALIEPLHLHPFALHLCVDSTRGKSTAALLAAAVWGHPDQTFRTWNTTAKSPEALAEQMNGTCLVLDEMAQFEGDPRTLGQTIHALCSPVGRSALDKNRDLSEQRRWRCTILSTGEVSAKQRLGEYYQGGHRVRFLDVHCHPGDESFDGELTTSKQHAECIARFCHEHYGVVSDAWIRYLLQPGIIEQTRDDYQLWRERAETYSGSNPEDGRIGAQLAVLALAMGHAAVAGLLPWGANEIERVLVWAIQATLHSDADDESEQSQYANTPQGRAYEQFITEWISQPQRFPDVDSIRAEMARDVVAYKRASVTEQGTCLFTTEAMLKRSRILESAGVSKPRKWIEWCIAQGLAVRDPQTLPIGGYQRWIVFRPRIG